VGHQLRVHTLDLLRDQAVPPRAAAVVFVAEGHRAQLHQAVARIAHVADVSFEAGRGHHDAEQAAAGDNYPTANHGCAADAGVSVSAISQRDAYLMALRFARF
jgi:hypothetical protein